MGGLLRFVGTLADRLMRPVWRTSGRSAIGAVASLVGSYSIGLLIFSRVNRAGDYSVREAAIIATGFSTGSVTFMVIVARTLDLMGHWNAFFWTAMGTTLLVTAVTVRLPPQSGMPVGLIGLLAARYTPLFDWLGYALYPLAWNAWLPDPLSDATASATGLAEMLLPALLITEGEFVTRFTVGVVSISSILFFSASIPGILATSIPITVPQMLVIWCSDGFVTDHMRRWPGRFPRRRYRRHRGATHRA